MRACPFCAEEIPDAEVICRFCGLVLPTVTRQAQAHAGPTVSARLPDPTIAPIAQTAPTSPPNQTATPAVSGTAERVGKLLGEAIVVVAAVALIAIIVFVTVAVFRWITTERPATADSDRKPTQKQTKTVPSPAVMSQPPAVVPSVPKATGLGVSRASIQGVFEQPNIGFTFEASTPVNGQPRVMGKASNGLSYIELIGPPDNLQSASIAFGADKNPEASALTGAYMLGLVKKAAPDWEGGPDWAIEALDAALTTGKTQAQVHGNVEVKMQVVKSLHIGTLTVSAR